MTVNPRDDVLRAGELRLPGESGGPRAGRTGPSRHRVTASVAWRRGLTGEGKLAAIVAWGRNVEQGDRPTDALPGEATLSSGEHVNLFGRAEYVVKAAGDLDVEGLSDEERLPLTTLALGHVFTIQPAPNLMLGIGVRGNLLLVPARVEDAYGSRVPIGGAVYLQARTGEGRRAAMEDGPHGH